MAYETKVILQLLADNIAKSKTLKEAYMHVQKAASVEGMHLPSYEDTKAEWEKAATDSTSE